MKIQYDPDVDALYISLAEGHAADSEEVHPGVILDYDSEDNVIGLELLYVTKRKTPIKLDDLQFQVRQRTAAG